MDRLIEDSRSLLAFLQGGGDLLLGKAVFERAALGLNA